MLPESLLSQLPASVAGAPWHTKCRVVTWLHTVDEAALEALPSEIRSAGISIVAWALVRYADTPVGPYDEVAATLLPADGDYGHIPFIVVDSLPSIVGGRVNWLLPKALAEFDWDDDDDAVTIRAHVPSTPAWSMRVSFEASGDASPLEVPNHVQQVSTDGDVRGFDGSMIGAMRSASVTVDGHADGPLASLLVPGRYDGTLLTDCEFSVGALNPA
ncbi:MAG TPA: acetoacetate decarboxylase family protein [Mycobacteriales bacterium]|nr:acetoacetate decarboxylase family protein [Mycobacteriales bacterium]